MTDKPTSSFTKYEAETAIRLYQERMGVKRQYIVAIQPPEGSENLAHLRYVVVAATLRQAIKIAHRIYETDFSEQGEAVWAAQANLTGTVVGP